MIILEAQGHFLLPYEYNIYKYKYKCNYKYKGLADDDIKLCDKCRQRWTLNIPSHVQQRIFTDLQTER